MQPLIKWPGGKSSEFQIIKKYIPEFNRYIEPFFGGGAVFFNLPISTSIINDISTNLMQFYLAIKNRNKVFINYLYSINEEWEKLKKLASLKANLLIPFYKQYRNNQSNFDKFIDLIKFSCSDVTKSIVNNSMILHLNNLHKIETEIYRMVHGKIIRTLSNEVKNKKNLSDDDLYENIITGFTSGYYMCLRNTLNMLERSTNNNTIPEYKLAIFYFIREYCYGSMFRYNNLGDFNIPYGGIAYNHKDFKKKIDTIISDEVYLRLKNAEILSTDFENVLNMAASNDFIFLDPPYDTNFSNYENRNFDEQDHVRLEGRLQNLKCKFLLIIKNTMFIEQLYSKNKYNIHAFDNQYAYCVKGRNDRNAVHLIITNY